MSTIIEEMDYHPRTYLWGVFTVFSIISIQLAVYYVVKSYRKTEQRKTIVKEETKTSTVSKKKTSSTIKSSKRSNSSSNEATSRVTRRQRGQWRGGRGSETFEHPWLLKNLKGHTGTVLDTDIAPNGKFLAAACEDRSVILWDIRDLINGKQLNNLRVNIEFDHATFVSWSPDSKAFIIHKAIENCIEVYKVEKKKNGMLASATKVSTFEKAYTEDTVSLDIASNGRFMISCSAATNLIIWDLKGNCMAQLDTYLVRTTRARISPCGRFVFACGFTPDVKALEVEFSKSGEFHHAKTAFELTGHKSGVYDVAFDVDTSHVATISKDGTFRIYDTKIEYKKGQCPYLVSSGTYTQGSATPLLALSPDASVLVVAQGTELQFYLAKTGELYDVIDGAFVDAISSLRFDATGKLLFVSGDRTVRVFHNVAGYHAAILGAQDLLRSSTTSTTRERHEGVIKESKAFLASVGK